MNLIRHVSKKTFPVFPVLFSLSLLVGCDESSSPASPADPVPASSASVEAFSSSVGQLPVEESSATSIESATSSALEATSSAVDAASSETAVVPGGSSYVPPTDPAELIYSIDPSLSVLPDADGFYYVADIYKALPATSKVVFVIRHSEREKSEGQESQLTENGVQMALNLGADMAGGDENFYYASTDFIRTRETCNNIAKGRGEVGNETVTWDGINGGYFIKVPTSELDTLVGKRGGSWKNISQWAYGVQFSNKYVANVADNYFYELYSRGHRFVNEVVLENLPNWKRVNILVSHDVLLEPLTVYATNRAIDLKFYESGKWINYMAGVAIVVNEAGAVSLFPVRGADVGWMYYVKQ